MIVAGAVLLVAVVVAVLVILAGSGRGTPTGSNNVIPSDAPVVTVGAVSGPNGNALMWIRQNNNEKLNIQWLQYGDIPGMVGALSAGGSDSIIVPESTKLGDDQVVVAKLYKVTGGENAGVQVLVTTTKNKASAHLKALVTALTSTATKDYLNSVGGFTVSAVN